jgi:hypothetical protein
MSSVSVETVAVAEAALPVVVVELQPLELVFCFG